MNGTRRTPREGAERAAEDLAGATGIDARVDLTRSSFVPVEDVPAELSDERYVGTVLASEGTPGGYALILFDGASAREFRAALDDVDPDADAERTTRTGPP